MKVIPSFDPSLTTSGQFDPLVSNACGKIVLFNESAYGLLLTFPNGNVQGLPPYYYRSFLVVKPGPVRWQQLYSVMVSGSSSFPVFGEAYESAEAKSLTFTEGPLNRQTNIGNTIPVSISATNLSNETQAAGTQIVDIGPVTNTGLILIYNDHFLWSVLQSGVVHQILKGATSGNPLQLGQLNDIVEVLGKLLIDQDLDAQNIILNNAGNKPKIYSSSTGNTDIDAPSGTHLWQLSSAGGITTYGQNLGLGTQGTGRNVLDTSASTTWLKAPSMLQFQVPPGTNLAHCDSNGLTIDANSLLLDTTGGIKALGANNIGLGTAGSSRNVLDYFSNVLYLKGQNTVQVQVPGGTNITHFDSSGLHMDAGGVNFLVGQITRAGGANGVSCGNGTVINHGLGVTPGIVLATPNIAQPGSASVGVGNIGSTSFTCTVGAGTAVDWLALA